jgi:hypothetical protein
MPYCLERENDMLFTIVLRIRVQQKTIVNDKT